MKLGACHLRATHSSFLTAFGSCRTEVQRTWANSLRLSQDSALSRVLRAQAVVFVLSLLSLRTWPPSSSCFPLQPEVVYPSSEFSQRLICVPFMGLSSFNTLSSVFIESVYFSYDTGDQVRFLFLGVFSTALHVRCICLDRVSKLFLPGQPCLSTRT